jgi:MFS family permease
MQPAISEPSGPDHILPGARTALLLLLAINLFNYIDRYVLAAVLPKLELDAEMFSASDPWLKTKLGMLTTAFMITYMLLSPVFGWLGDQRSRWVLVGIGVILWSLASGGSGLAIGFWMLICTRCLVGVGEAAYGPVAPSMLSDLYPEKQRGKVLSWFYMAIPVGSALGFVLGGQVAQTSLGWRGAFLVVVVPGIILGCFCFFMHEPPRDKSHSVKAGWGGYFHTVKHLLRIRSFRCATIGLTLICFIQGGVAVWAPYYVLEREARYQVSAKNLENLENLKSSDGTPLVPANVIAEVHKIDQSTVFNRAEFRTELRKVLSKDDYEQHGSRIIDAMPTEDSITLGKVNFFVGAIVVLGGLLATLFGGWLGDKLRDKYRGSYFLVSGYSAIIAFPLFLGMLYVPFPYAWILMFLAVFGLFVNTGPANTILANVTAPTMRATGFAFNILIIHMLGDAISPTIIGYIADQTSLTRGFELAAFFTLIGGLIWVWGSRFLHEDTLAAAQDVPA